MKFTILLTLFLTLTFTLSAQKIQYSAHLSGPSPQEYESNQYLFIDFWATWCIPCIKSMSHVEYLQSLFSDRVFFINLSNEQADRVKKFLERSPIKTSNLIDYKGLNFEKYNITSIPKSILLSPDGNILWKGHPSDMSPQKLRSLISGPSHSGSLQLVYKPIQYEKAKPIKYEYLLIRKFFFNVDTISLALSSYKLHKKMLRSDEELYYQGDFHSLLAMLLYTQSSQLVHNPKLDKNIRIRIPLNYWEHSRNEVLEKLSERFKFRTDSTEQLKERIIIVCNDSTTFMDSDWVDFGESRTLVSDNTIEADDMTCQEFSEVMSEVMGKMVVFKNPPKGVYDWDIQYKYKNLMIDQFKYDYHADYREEKAIQMIYTTEFIPGTN